MAGKYPVITLCGSTRFKEQFFEAQKRLTLAGNIVISVGLFGHSGDDEDWTKGTKEMLGDMYKKLTITGGCHLRLQRWRLYRFQHTLRDQVCSEVG